MNETEFLKQMGAKIRKAREKKDIPLTKLGKITGIHYSSLSRMETGHNDMHILILKKLAEALDADVKDFL